MKLVKLGMVGGALLVAACGGSDGAQGPKGDPGATGATGPAGTGVGPDGGAIVESINGITPARGFTGRQVRITISGDNTNYATAPTVTIDDAAIKVGDVEVASPSAVILTLDIGDDATAGEKTITVGAQTFKGFQVEFPVSVKDTLGDQAQGSIMVVDYKNHDLENFFDTTSTFDSQFNQTFTGMTASTSTPGTHVQVSNVTETSLSAFVLTDIDATLGDVETELQSTDDLGYRTGKVATIAARAAQELAAGAQPTDVPIGSPYSTKLFKISYTGTATGGLFDFAVTGGDNAPQVFGLGTSGKWADAGSTPTFARPNTDASAYFVVADLSGAANYTASLSPAVTPFAGSALGTTNSTPATALTVTADGTYLAEVTGPTDADWYTFHLATSNEAIEITTTGLEVDPTANHVVDTLVTLYAAADTTNALATSDDKGYNEDLTSASLAAGDYLVRVTNSAEEAATPGATAYAFKVVVTDPPAP